MKKKTFKVSLFLVAMMLIFVQCKKNNSSSKVNKLFGTYIFQFPSKEIEILTINKDSTYDQIIFSSFKRYKENSSPKYINKGSWKLDKDYELSFDNWLSFCLFNNPKKRLNYPEPANLLNVYWNESKGHIALSYEKGYVFEKIENWIDDQNE